MLQSSALNQSNWPSIRIFANMLGLQLPSDPRWAHAASMRMDDLLTDHCWCEQKAASTAISLMVGYPELDDLVQAMSALAREEMSHFEMVHAHLMKRGLKLGTDNKDAYVARIKTFFPPGGHRMTRLVHRLLTAALIEARSCERFRLLSSVLEDKELSTFYSRLMVSEASHYTMFLQFARQYGDLKQVNALWQGLLVFEAKVLAEFDRPEFIHG